LRQEGEQMEARDAIGIDPDSRGFVCAQVKVAQPAVVTKSYTTSDSDLKAFLRWVQGQGDVIVAIEGSNGLSRPLEKALREAGIIFYSFKPADTDKFRKAVLGQNKDNRKDAESVARYAMAMEAQGRLQRYRRVWFADPELQLLSRSYERKTQECTAEVNRLWKLIRLASPDLYLAFGGRHPQVELNENALQTQGILTLLSQNPDIGTWKNLSQQQMLEAMGGGKYKGRQTLIEELAKLSSLFRPISAAMALMIRSSAEQIQRLKREQAQISRMLEEVSRDNKAVQALKHRRGIATITATALVAEIVDIRRFAREDSLACYSGLGMAEHSSGQTARMVPSRLFNHRLKDAFITAARNVVPYDPDSHLAGYHRNLVKAGMSPMEATKRCARALVRVIYRQLTVLIKEESPGATPRQLGEKGEGDMASGSLRSDQSHTSNISPSSLPASKARANKNVKGGRRAVTCQSRNNIRSRRTRISQKRA
jgi:transposase